MRFFEETPGMGILRNLLYGLIIALIYMYVMILLWRFNTEFLLGYVLIGLSLSFFGWGGERLWLVTISNFFNRSSGWKVLLSRIPLWAMFGGMGYTIAVVLAMKYKILNAQLVPIKNMFFIGAKISCIVQLFLLLITQQSKPLQPTIKQSLL